LILAQPDDWIIARKKKRKPYGIGRWNDGFAGPLWITPGLAVVVSVTDLKPEDGQELHLSAAEDRRSFSWSGDTAPGFDRSVEKATGAR
jgi:hypothetical protein